MAELRGRIDELQQESAAAIRRELASYEVVAAEDLDASVRVNCNTANEVLAHCSIHRPRSPR